MKILPQVVSCALVLTTAALADAGPKNVASLAPLYQRAQSRAPAPPRAAPPPRQDLGPAPDSPSPVHFRHGFYLRLGVGGGYVSDHETVSGGSGGSLHGPGETFDVFLGGSIVPGLALGGGFTVSSVSNPTVEYEGQSIQGSGSLSLGILSGFADWYPSPTGGLHVLAMGGYAAFGANDAGGDSIGPTARGLSLGLGVGYEWSLGAHWGVGAMARYIYAPLRATTSTGTAAESVTTPELMFTGTMY